jgi:hypothetical protein
MPKSIQHFGGMRQLSAFLSLVAAVLLFVAVPAEAKPGYIVTPPQHTAELQMKGTNGFSIQIKLWNGRVLEVSAYKNPDVVIYLTRGVHAQGNRIEATLPRVGRIRVDFQAAGRAHREPGFFPPCKGGETVKQPGYFHGTIRLRGERGYTTARATRVHGQIVNTAKEVCKRSIFNHGSNPKTEYGARLFAASTSKERSVTFSATTLETSNFPSPASVFFTGIVRERRQGMAIFRQAIARGGPNALAPADESEFPPSATATPAAPFQGSATFERNTEGTNAWRGDLSVDLPGLGRVALAGPGFAARFCQAEGCKPLG